MAISKWLNILAFHLLEVRKHSSFPTSFLIRSYQSQSFSVWPCESGLLPQALSSLGIDQGLIPITWQGQFHLVLWGGRGEIFLSWSRTSWFVYLPLFRITVTLVPSEREGLFLGWQKSWSAMGLSAPGAQQAWLPSENGQPVTVRHLLIQSMARCMRWAPTFNQSQWESGSKAPSYIQPSPGCHCILAGRVFLIREGGRISLPVIQPVSVEGCLASKLLVWKKMWKAQHLPSRSSEVEFPRSQVWIILFHLPSGTL